ncbi:Ppx/GppA family phosphatase [Lactobacillus alvi]|uniref:Ppx/GppA family phosphatase n=1 Tax=Limosilactobacillus alvi TaxID=990412 RepID=A0ABS2ELN8_9LACO|nr:Ppx/GppA family phosphatase [Limosilactobacillus alvi]MBM6753310.1 Ppx/GppA family phosphatase [Limosilactobacillus alvi]
MTNLAIIDLGSNSCRLQISEIYSNGKHQLIKYEKEFVRLSENMGPEKILKPEPIERTITALKKFATEWQALKDVRLIAVATAAVRQATNQAEFLERVKKEVGIEFNVISGEREAYLDYVGVSRTLTIQNGLIIDTGGASMELILVDEGQAEEVISLPIGSVLLSQRYNLGDVINPADLYDAVVKVDEVLTSQRWLNRARHTRVVALGGSNRALAKLFRWKLAASPTHVQPVHGLKMQSQDAFALMHSLVAANKIERTKMRGIAAARADVIVGGLLPLMALLRQLSMQEVMFSNNGLREGLLFEYLDHQLDGATIQKLN